MSRRAVGGGPAALPLEEAHARRDALDDVVPVDVVVAADAPVAVDRHEPRGVGDLHAQHGVALVRALDRQREARPAQVVDRLLVTGQEPPPLVVRAVRGGVAAQHLGRVARRIDGDRDQARGAAGELRLQLGHGGGHLRTRTGAGREEEVAHPGRAGEVGARHRAAVASDEREVGHLTEGLGGVGRRREAQAAADARRRPLARGQRAGRDEQRRAQDPPRARGGAELSGGLGERGAARAQWPPPSATSASSGRSPSSTT